MEKNQEVKKSKEEGKEGKKAKFEFADLAEAEQYLDWKKSVPQKIRRLVESTILEKKLEPSQTGLPLSDQFLDVFGESLRQKRFSVQAGADPKINNLLEPLEKVGTKGGYLNVFETLANKSVSWSLKNKIYKTQIKPALEWLVEQDLKNLFEKNAQESEEKKEQSRGEQQKSESTEISSNKPESPENQIPSQSEDVRSSMESGMEKREGEPQAQFRVNPFYGGYYKQLTFNKFNLQNLKWEKSENVFREAETESTDLLKNRVLAGKIKGNAPLSLPLPYNWALEIESLQIDAPAGSAKISRNQNGLWYLDIDAEGVFSYQIKTGPRKFLEAEEELPESEMAGELPAELFQKIEELKKSSLPKMRQIRELAKFIRSNLTYSNNSEAWKFYAEDGKEFFKNIWQRKEADCFVANTLAVRAISEIEKNVNFAGGFFVKEKNKDGEAVMHAGNGHAWLEVWDLWSGRAVRLDATPKGDPNLDEEQQEKDLEGDSPAEEGEGDYGESDEELASEEEIKKKIKEMQKRQAAKEKRKTSPVDLEQARFAELAECTPAQAREFFNALERVRQIKDKNGHSISDSLKDKWKKIIVERKIETVDYKGPVRMDEGDHLEDPASALIDIRSREFNPGGFEKQEKTEKFETDFGGIDIYFSFDLSGSMREIDGASGRSKADVQRDVALLFVDSLMQCAYISRQQGDNSDLLPIKIMVTLASDGGDVKLHLTDKWGPKEQWAFYRALNQLAGGGTPTHRTLKLIEIDLDKELAELKKKKVSKEKMPLHYVAEISDGVPDDFSKTEAMHQNLKKKGAVVRSYTIGGESASEDAAEPLESFSQLPEILGKDIIEKFILLNPRRIRK